MHFWAPHLILHRVWTWKQSGCISLAIDWIFHFTISLRHSFLLLKSVICFKFLMKLKCWPQSFPSPSPSFISKKRGVSQVYPKLWFGRVWTHMPSPPCGQTPVLVASGGGYGKGFQTHLGSGWPFIFTSADMPRCLFFLCMCVLYSVISDCLQPHGL